MLLQLGQKSLLMGQFRNFVVQLHHVPAPEETAPSGLLEVLVQLGENSKALVTELVVQTEKRPFDFGLWNCGDRAFLAIILMLLAGPIKLPANDLSPEQGPTFGAEYAPCQRCLCAHMGRKGVGLSFQQLLYQFKFLLADNRRVSLFHQNLVQRPMIEPPLTWENIGCVRFLEKCISHIFFVKEQIPYAGVPPTRPPALSEGYQIRSDLWQWHLSFVRQGSGQRHSGQFGPLLHRSPSVLGQTCSQIGLCT
mgnify:FL=1